MMTEAENPKDNNANSSAFCFDKQSIEQMNRNELVAYYKKIFKDNPRLFKALLKLYKEKENAKPHLSRLQILQQYPEAISAIAISKFAIQRAVESNNPDEYRKQLSIARTQINNALSSCDLPPYIQSYLKTLGESIDQVVFNSGNAEISQEQKAAVIEIQRYFPPIISKIREIHLVLSDFLEEFQKTAYQNERTSKRYAYVSAGLSILAIIVAIYSGCNNGTDKIVNAIYKTHSWSNQEACIENNDTINHSPDSPKDGMEKKNCNQQINYNSLFRPETKTMKDSIPDSSSQENLPTEVLLEDNSAIASQSNKKIKKICIAFMGEWFADRERHAELVAAQIAKDVADIKAGKKEYRSGHLISIEPASNPEEYYRQISDKNAMCDVKRLGSAMLEAALELSGCSEEDISDDPIDQDFFNHWRREAELIDDEEVRQWWAHLLVEETKKPKSISPRTLDVAKNLSKEEAQLFAKLAKSIVVQSLLVNHQSEPLGGSYGDVLSLQDAGLVSSQISHRDYYAVDIDSHHCILLPFIDSNCIVIFEYAKITIRCYVLTTAGREIHKISLNHLSIDEIKAITDAISKQNGNAFGSIYPICNVSQDPENERYLHFDVDWEHPIWTNRPEAN